MGTFITVLILIVCALLIVAVLIQNSKGGGLASNFASSTQVMGVKRTADFLEKSTWSLAGALLFLCIVSAAVNTKNDGEARSQSEIEEYIQNNQPVTPPSGFQNNPEQK